MDRLFARRYTIEFEWKASQLCYRSVTLWMSWKSEKRPRSEDDTRHGPHNILHKRKFRHTYTCTRRSWENTVYIFLGTFGQNVFDKTQKRPNRDIRSLKTTNLNALLVLHTQRPGVRASFSPRAKSIIRIFVKGVGTFFSLRISFFHRIKCVRRFKTLCDRSYRRVYDGFILFL